MVNETTSQSETRDESSERGSQLPVLVMIAGGLLLPVVAWLHRPLSMRNYGDATMVALQGTWVLKAPFFYGSYVASAALLFAAGVRLWRRSALAPDAQSA